MPEAVAAVAESRESSFLGSRVAQRLFLLAQWLVVVLALFLLYRLWVRDDALPPIDRTAWNQWEGFVAISYGGITRNPQPGQIDRALLRQHLETLAGAGYQSVSTDDLLRALKRQQPLPSKALYLFFEAGRKDSLVYSQPVLLDVGFRASIYLLTGRLESWDRFYLARGDVSRVAENAYWDIQSLGDRSAEQVEVDSQGKRGAFLASRRWISEEQRRESTVEAGARILADAAESQRVLSDLLGHPPAAYCLYPANLFQGDLEGEILEANREALSSFSMAFTRSGEAFNAINADPHTLVRLRVPADWSGAELLERLNNSWPRNDTLDGGSVSGVWAEERGACESGGGIRVRPEPETRSAFCGLRGSEQWSNVDVQFEWTPRLGRLWIYARHQGPGSYLRMGIGEGQLILQEATPSGLQTLLRQPVDLGTSPGRFRLVVKQNRLWVWHNEALLLKDPVPLASVSSRGKVALAVDPPGGDQLLAGFRATPITTRWLVPMGEDSIDFDTRLLATHALIQVNDSPDSNELRKRLLHLASDGIFPVLPRESLDGALPNWADELANVPFTLLTEMPSEESVSEQLPAGFKMAWLVPSAKSSRDWPAEHTPPEFLVFESAPAPSSLDEFSALYPPGRTLVPVVTAGRLAGWRTSTREER